LLIMKKRYGFIQYVSFEQNNEERKENYYRALMEGQKNRYKKTEKIDRWILFFLDCLSTLIKRLEAKYEVYSKLTKELNERQQSVLEFVKKRKAVRMSEIEEAFKTHSRNTLKKDMAYLVNEGLLLKTGERKGTRYHYLE